MNIKEVSVLGTPYIVKVGEREEVGLCKDSDGECRQYSHIIKVHHSFEGVDEITERNQRTEEIVAHEMFHAFVAESGLDISEDIEENLACWYMKVWKKMNNNILQVLDDNHLLE